MVRLVSAMLVASTILRSPAGAGAQRRILLLRSREISVQRQDRDCAMLRRSAGFLERAMHPADFGRARQEAQDVAVVDRAARCV